MASASPSRRNAQADAEVNQALAALIANTKRRRRKLSLLEIARYVADARRGLGGLRAVADRIDLSEEMLRQFAVVETLSPAVKRLVARRDIDSVDVAHRIARLPASDQLLVAEAVVARRLDSKDVRAIVAFRRALPNVGIEEILRRVEDSRDVTEYLAEFITSPSVQRTKTPYSRFAALVGHENVRSLRFEGAVGILAINAVGRRHLQEAARTRGLTKRQLIEQIVAEEVD